MVCSVNRGRTFLAPLFLGSVDVVLELDADLPLVGLVSDERVFQKLLCWRTLGVVLHQAALNETEELLGPGGTVVFRCSIKLQKQEKLEWEYKDKTWSRTIFWTSVEVGGSWG